MLISATDTVSPNSDDGGSGDHAVVLPVQRYVPSTGTAVHFVCGCRQAGGQFFLYMNVCVCVFAYTKSTAVQKELVVVVVAATMAALVVIAS